MRSRGSFRGHSVNYVSFFCKLIKKFFSLLRFFFLRAKKNLYIVLSRIFDGIDVICHFCPSRRHFLLRNFWKIFDVILRNWRKNHLFFRFTSKIILLVSLFLKNFLWQALYGKKFLQKKSPWRSGKNFLQCAWPAEVGYLLVFDWEVAAMDIIGTICDVLQTIAIIYGMFFKH